MKNWNENRLWQGFTYVFKSIFAELTKEAEKAKSSEPSTPKDNFVHILDVEYSKDKNKFVEDKIPKFVFQMLPLGGSQFSKNEFLDGFAQQN